MPTVKKFIEVFYLQKDIVIKKKVIFAWNYIEWGGAQIYFLSIIKNSTPDWEYTIVLPKKSKPDLIKFFEPFGVKFDFVETELDISNARGVLQKLKRQWKRIKSEIKTYRHLKKYDLKNSILHIESAPWQSWILLYFLTRKGNVFVTMHNAMPHYVPKWRKAIWRLRLNFLLKQKKFNFYTANQNAIDSLQKFISVKYRHKLILTRASINPREIERVLAEDNSKDNLLKKNNLPSGKFIVLSVGQFIDRKGRWIFLEAAKKTIQKEKDILFVWLTPQFPSEPDLKKIEEFGLGDSFRLVLSETVGKNRDDVLNFFRIADIFALPSLWEGLPIAILEAMALKIPTISTNLNAIPEAIIHNETGILIETGNAASLAEAILNLFENKQLRESLAIAGHDYVVDKFDEAKAAKIALDNYEKCLKK